uniref:PEHE domain-containing protein n=1 Tax=Rhodnius prolixus TaxID=13249 RepID=T1HVK4_RHOPR
MADISLSVHQDAVMKSADWQVKASRISSKSQLSNTMAASEEGLDGTAASAGNTGTVIGGSSVSGIVRNIPHQVGRPRKQHGTLSASSINYQSSLNSSDNTPSDGGLLPDHHLDLQRSKAAAHAVSVKLRRKIAGGRKRRKNNIPLERFRHRKNSGGYSILDGDYLVDSGEVSTNTDGARYPSSPVPSPASVHGKDKESMKRKRENSYDIDNIVIPYSMASATRLEKLHYKEILTPKWRFVKEMDHKNGIVRRSSQELLEGEEDMNEETFIERHNQAEEEERKKFLSYMKVPNSVLNSFLGSSGSGRGRGHRRADSRAESFGPNTPDPMSPGGGESSMTSPPATPQTATNTENQTEQPGSVQLVSSRRRTTSTSKISTEMQSFPSASDYVPEVISYEPRTFPLSEEVFNKMLAENSDNNHQGYLPLEANFFQLENLESPPSVSTDSAESLTGEDPNDPEWTGFGGKNNVKR